MKTIVTKNSSEVEWGWGCKEGGITHGMKEILGDDGSVCYFDYDHGFIGLNICKTDQIEYFRYF